MGRAHRRLLRWDEIKTEHRIPRATLASWKRRGHIRPFARDGRTLLYLEADVLRCKRDRDAAGRAVA